MKPVTHCLVQYQLRDQILSDAQGGARLGVLDNTLYLQGTQCFSTLNARCFLVISSGDDGAGDEICFGLIRDGHPHTVQTIDILFIVSSNTIALIYIPCS